MDRLAVTMAGEITLSKDPGGSLKKWREIFGISQTELAEYIKISSSTISDYEGGRRKSPGINVVNRFVESLMTIDNNRGGKIQKQLERDFAPKEEIFDTHEFGKALSGEKFMELVGGECVTSPARLKETQIYGYTVIDSLKVILEVPVHEYLQLYGKTPERAVLFQQVENGRSPMIAI
ncbi:MAG: helix-turn-helix domain-containing protein, partial [Candidatus Diapherotrites archaeon]|nr:helix-turn-helix domain-containing protein [Candidatus Diapherotrites archaeon]